MNSDSPITHSTETEGPLNPTLVQFRAEDGGKKRSERALFGDLAVHEAHASMSEREVGA